VTTPPGPDDFRRALGRFASGVTVIATCHGDILHGMTANAFASVSLDPLLVLVCVDREAGMHLLLPQTERFAVSILSADQEEQSVWFASPRRPTGTDQFDGVDWSPAPVTGCPVLAGSLAWVDCRVVAVHDGGDHTIFVGEVLATGVAEGEDPLVYWGSAYRRLAD
jgi:flavin reductase (DIM6/NTAB) family NADH-FMN oxidoreductase RutF